MKFLSVVTYALSVVAAVGASSQPPEPALEPNYTSPLGVQYINPSASYDVTGPYSLLSIAGPTLYVAGVRGIHPSNNSLAETGYPRIRLAYENMAYLARSAGSDLVRTRPPLKQRVALVNLFSRHHACVWLSMWRTCTAIAPWSTGSKPSYGPSLTRPGTCCFLPGRLSRYRG